MTTAPSDQLVGAALWYASCGWPVFPVHSMNEDGSCTCGNPHTGRDATNIAKHPRTPNGFLAATTDNEQIRAWWEQWPTANIGVRLGEPSGLLVADVDPRNGGDATLGTYLYQHGDLPPVPEVKTGGGGWHFYFRWPQGMRGTSLPGGIDIKADGGYVLVPPSVHKDGPKYEWQRKPHRGEELPDPPDWVVKETTAKQREPIKRDKPVSEGDRHSWLVRVAGGLRRYGFDADQIYHDLYEQNIKWCLPPLSNEEIASIAYSADWNPADIGLTTPRSLVGDIGNAERLIDRHGEDLRYVSGLGWLVWDTRRWLRNEYHARRLAIDTVRNIFDEIHLFNMTDEDEIKAVLKHWRASQSSSRLDGMEKVARSDERVSAKYEDFDKDTFSFNVMNGTIDLRTGELREHSRGDLITKLAPVVYDPKATCPLFMEHLRYFLEEIRDGESNRNVINYLRRLLGYCLTGEMREGVFPIFWGSGGNGKSTLLRAIRRIMGPDYSQTAPRGFLIAQQNDPHPTSVARLAGTRLVVASEIERGKQLNVAQMKEFTGEDTITAHFMRENDFEFPVTFKIIYLTNDKPDIRNPEDATWNRIKLVPFERQIEPEKRDREIDQKLAAEYSGILNWLIEGCLEWQKHGLMEPDEVKVATQEYREDSDASVGEFVRTLTFVEPQPDRGNFSTALLRTFNDWAKANGDVSRFSHRGFTLALKARPEFKGRYIRKSKGSFWMGVLVAGQDVNIAGMD